MSKSNVLLIGAGQIGSRHLQGLAKKGIPLSVSIVEPDISRAEVAKVRLNAVCIGYSEADYRFYLKLASLETKRYDLAIIATNSDTRELVINELLQLAEVKNILLEKIVFQSPDIFPGIIEKFRIRNIRSWVNCPRRLFPVYIEIKELLKNQSQLSVSVTGGEWGLACNSLHFIDLFAFLSDSFSVISDEADLDPVVIESKRKGFIEFTGKLEFKNTKGSLILESMKNSSATALINILSDDYEIQVYENSGEYTIAGGKFHAKGERRQFNMPFQSDLTGFVTGKILKGEEPGLVSIEDSFVQHSAFLNVLLKHLSLINGVEYKYCPIT